jgi:hypothetical protein
MLFAVVNGFISCLAQEKQYLIGNEWYQTLGAGLCNLNLFSSLSMENLYNDNRNGAKSSF